MKKIHLLEETVFASELKKIKKQLETKGYSDSAYFLSLAIFALENEGSDTQKKIVSAV